jgi:DNA-binding GntR family transcriptional regulator
MVDYKMIDIQGVFLYYKIVNNFVNTLLPAWDSMAKKKSGTSLKQKIYKQLRHDIVFGRILPGEHLKEARLTNKFQCSRGPVREAFNQLDSEGFLVLLRNQGAVVSKTSPEEIADFYAMLELLEAQAVKWATPRLEASDIEKLQKINADIKRISCEDKGSIEPWSSSNLEFHRLFRKKCGNGQIDRIIEDIRMRITRYRHMSLLVTAYDEYVLDHEKIIDAVTLGHAEEAGNVMRIHIRRAKNVLMEFLSKFPGF